MRKACTGSQGGSFRAIAVACVAGVAAIDVLAEEQLVESAASRGAQLLDAAKERAIDGIGDVRGLGLMVGSEFTASDGAPHTARAQAVQQEAARRGLLLLPCGAHMNVVRMIPPLVVTEEEINEGLTIWSEVLAAV